MSHGTPGRFYTPDRLGGLCSECRNPIPAALAGVTMHPTCHPDWSQLVKASQQAARRKRADTRD